MKVFWESGDWPGARVDPGITSLDWIPSRDSGGLLGAGSESGAVGVTATDVSTSGGAGEDSTRRYNYNLRGHHSAISLVAWNAAQTKLASCDQSGVIYVWSPNNEERWTVELVNDRGVKVRDLSWSPSGNSALICYEDNFVLIGSATGQRIWSNSYQHQVLCGAWAPDSRELLLGTGSGTIDVLTDQGTSVTEITLLRDHGSAIRRIACSAQRKDGSWTVAVCSAQDRIYFLRAYDDADPMEFHSPEPILAMNWSGDGQHLAVISSRRLTILGYDGRVMLTNAVPIANEPALTAFTWAHDNRVLVLAAGGRLIVGRVLHGVPSLFQLSAYKIWTMLNRNGHRVDQLPLPNRERCAVKALDHHVIRCRIPDRDQLCSLVCAPSDWRWYCTIRSIPRKQHSYMLCMEHMGGLVPVLEGRQVNRLVPQFHISLPTARSILQQETNGSSAQVEDAGAFHRTSQRNSVWRRSKRQLRAMMTRHVNGRGGIRHNERLMQVTSNVWCTRFKITSLSPQLLPHFLAQVRHNGNRFNFKVVYKTSVLHLQPRQMTVQLVDLSHQNNPPGVNSAQPSFPTGDDGLILDISDVAPPIAPSEREIFDARLLPNNAANDATSPVIPFEDDTDELLVEERVLLEKVLTEFSELRLAIDRHIFMMKKYAVDLEKSSIGLDCASTSTSRVPRSNVQSTAQTTTAWQSQLDALEFIDSEENSGERMALIPEEPRRVFRQLNDISKVLGQLSHMAELSSRSSVAQLSGDRIPSRGRGSVAVMRNQICAIAHSVSQLERRIKVGTELVEEVRGDLQDRVRQLRSVLGDQAPILASLTTSPHHPDHHMLVMTNKTPFWNEQSQVYQLDFGGRVTQESAKNFQIEYADKQVMQFGRIESGSYTLDFRRPFCAAQAFAVALASITQRLK